MSRPPIPDELEEKLSSPQASRPLLAWLFLGLQVATFAWARQRSQSWMMLEYPHTGWIGPLVDFTAGGPSYLIATEPLRVLSCLFLDVFGVQVLINLYMFWQMGPELERAYGKVRFAFLYVAGGLGSMLLCDLLHRFVPSLGVGMSYGIGERHAIFVVYGSVVGLVAAFRGIRAAAMSRLVWGRLAMIGVIVLLAYLLRRQGTLGIGIDLARWLTDLVVGTLLGWFLGLSLRKGTRQLAGIALSAAFLLGVAGELGYFVANARTDGRAPTPAGTGGASPNAGGRLPEEALTPPRPTMPAEEDPAEIAKVRGKAAKFLAPFSPLPEKASDADVRREAAALAAELDDFDAHWTETVSANLEVERAELRLVAGEAVAASKIADEGVKLLAGKAPPPNSQASQRLARLYGALAMVDIGNKDDIAARAHLERAREANKSLPEVHFFLGKLSNDPKRQKDELVQFLKQLEVKPPAEGSAREQRGREARSILGD